MAFESGSRVAPPRVRATIERRPVASLFVGAFAWSWGYWALVWLLLGPAHTTYLVTWPGLWGPAIAGVAVARARGRDVRSFLVHDEPLRARTRWYAVAIVGFLAYGLLRPVIQAALSGATLSPNGPFGVLLAVVVAVFAGGSEEVGLRGVAHPELRARLGTVGAGLAIGAPWALWHLPLQALGVGFGGSFWLFAAALLPLSVLLGWLYDASDDGVLVAVFAHAAVDAPPLATVAGDVPRSVVVWSRVGSIAALCLAVAALVAHRAVTGGPAGRVSGGARE